MGGGWADYVLRVVIYNTSHVAFRDVSFAGEKMSDIYVKGALKGLEDQSKKTDVHYRSLDGEGNFNWRLNFPFKYLVAEQQLVIERKPHVFSRELEISKVPAKINLQVWDADVFGPDDYIGAIELDLNNFYMPAQKVQKRDSKTDSRTKGGWVGPMLMAHGVARFGIWGGLQAEKARPRTARDTTNVSLFRKRRVRGWYAVTDGEDAKKQPIVTVRKPAFHRAPFSER